MQLPEETEVERRASLPAVSTRTKTIPRSGDDTRERRRSSSSIKNRVSFLEDNPSEEADDGPRTPRSKRRVRRTVSDAVRSDNLAVARSKLRPKPKVPNMARWCFLDPPALSVAQDGHTTFDVLAGELTDKMTPDAICTVLVQTQDLFFCLQHFGTNAPTNARANSIYSMEYVEKYFQMPIPIHNSSNNKSWSGEVLQGVIETLSTTHRAASLQKKKLSRLGRKSRIEAWEVTFDDERFQQTITRIQRRSSASETWCIFNFVEQDKRHRLVIVEEEGHRLDILRQQLPKEECRFVLIDMLIGHVIRQHRIILALWVPPSQANSKHLVALVRQRAQLEEKCQAVKFLRLGSRQHFRRSMLESKLHLAGLLDEILLRVVVRHANRRVSKSHDPAAASSSLLKERNSEDQKEENLLDDEDDDSIFVHSPVRLDRSASESQILDVTPHLIPWPFYTDRHALFGDLRVELARRFNLIESMMEVTLVIDTLVAKPQQFSRANETREDTVLIQKEKRLHELKLEHGSLIFLEEKLPRDESKPDSEDFVTQKAQRRHLAFGKILDYISHNKASLKAIPLASPDQLQPNLPILPSPSPLPAGVIAAPIPQGLQPALTGAALQQHLMALQAQQQARSRPEKRVTDDPETKEKSQSPPPPNPSSLGRTESFSSTTLPDFDLPYPIQALPENMVGGGASIDLDDIFIVQDNIGRGRTATVHQALYQDLVMVAVKEFKFSRLTESVMTIFEQEVETLKLLRHPNIAAFVGSYVDKEAKELWLVLEWLPGGCLRDVLADREVDIEYDDVLTMALDIARGMEYLHDHGIMHRDLKSHNLLLDDEYRVKVTDFGTARHFDGIYQAFTEVGTLGYIAPEVVEPPPDGYTMAVDIFSYGVLLWELYTRNLDNPLTNLGTFSYARKVLDGFRPSIPEDCPRSFARLISDCWATEPSERPQFGDIVKRLTRMIGRTLRESKSQSLTV